MCIKRRQIHKKQLSFVCTEIPWCQNLLLLTSSKGTLDWMYNFQVSSSLLLSQRNQVKKHQQHNTANVPVLLPIREFFFFLFHYCSRLQPQRILLGTLQHSLECDCKNIQWYEGNDIGQTQRKLRQNMLFVCFFFKSNK